MRLATTHDNGQVFQHFGQTAQFKVYDIEDGKVIAAKIIDTNGNGHGALAGILKDINVDALICGGIGGGAKMALDEANIQLFCGISGAADEVVNEFLEGKLVYNSEAGCAHHDHEHNHGEEHTCGSHGCGQHDCH